LFYYITHRVDAEHFAWDNDKKGRTLILDENKTLFFPALGDIERGKNAAVTHVGTSGLYWSASQGEGGIHYTRYLGFSSSGKNADSAPRACGFSIRAVAEE
jgi:hypothetical protein